MKKNPNPISVFFCECGYEINSTRTLGDPDQYAKPLENDVSLCGKCTRIHIFDKDLKLNIPTDLQLKEIKNSYDWRYIRKFRKLIYEHNVKQI